MVRGKNETNLEMVGMREGFVSPSAHAVYRRRPAGREVFRGKRLHVLVAVGSR